MDCSNFSVLRRKSDKSCDSKVIASKRTTEAAARARKIFGGKKKEAKEEDIESWAFIRSFREDWEDHSDHPFYQRAQKYRDESDLTTSRFDQMTTERMNQLKEFGGQEKDIGMTITCDGMIIDDGTARCARESAARNGGRGSIKPDRIINGLAYFDGPKYDNKKPSCDVKVNSQKEFLPIRVQASIVHDQHAPSMLIASEPVHSELAQIAKPLVKPVVRSEKPLPSPAVVSKKSLPSSAEISRREELFQTKYWTSNNERKQRVLRRRREQQKLEPQRQQFRSHVKKITILIPTLTLPITSSTQHQEWINEVLPYGVDLSPYSFSKTSRFLKNFFKNSRILEISPFDFTQTVTFYQIHQALKENTHTLRQMHKVYNRGQKKKEEQKGKMTLLYSFKRYTNPTHRNTHPHPHPLEGFQYSTSIDCTKYNCTEASKKISQHRHCCGNLSDVTLISHSQNEGWDITSRSTQTCRVAQSLQPSIEEQENTTFAEQRTTDEDVAILTDQLTLTHMNRTMDEQLWHTRNILSKPLPIYQGQWTTGDAQGKQLTGLVIPRQITKGIHSSLIGMFTYFRAGVTLRIQLNGTKFNSGKLLFAYFPWAKEMEDDKALYTDSQCAVLPNIMLDASASNVGILKIPFIHLLSYFMTDAEEIPTEGDENLGWLRVIVFNQLRAGTSTATALNYTIWASFDNAEVHQPSTAVTPFQRSRPEAQALQAAEGLAKSAAPALVDLLAPGAGSAMSSVIGSVTNLDKPSNPTPIPRVVMTSVSDLCHGSGLDDTTRLSLYPGSSTLHTKQILSTGRDDMDFKTITQIPMRIATTPWTSSQNNTQYLNTIGINPCWCKVAFKTTPEKIQVSVFETTPLAWLCRMSKFWRGSLKVRVEVVASQMHTGRLMIAYMAGESPVNAKSIEFASAANYNTYTLDLEENKVVEFVIPYMSGLPWLRCDQLTSNDATAVNNPYAQFNGTLNVYVMNKLAVPTGVSSIVDINFYLSAGDDLEVGVPCDLTGCIGAGSGNVEFSTRPNAQSLNTPSSTTTRNETGSVVLSRLGSGLPRQSLSTLSESSNDLKTVMRRYYQVYDWQQPTTSEQVTTVFAFENSPCLSTVNTCFDKDLSKSQNGRQNRTLLGHLSELYTFWRGTLRYSLVFGNTENQHDMITIFHIPGVFPFSGEHSWNIKDNTVASYNDLTITSALTNYGTIVFQGTLQAEIRFEIPFYTQFNMLRTQKFQGTKSSLHSTGSIVVMYQPVNKTSQLRFKLFQSAGDDFLLYYMRAPPQLMFLHETENRRDMTFEATWPFIGNKNICTGLVSASEPRPEAQQQNLHTQHASQPQQVTRPTAQVEQAHDPQQDGVATEQDASSGESDDPDAHWYATLKSWLKPTVVSKVETFADKASHLADNLNGLIDTAHTQIQQIVAKLGDIGGIAVDPVRLVTDGSIVATSLYTFFTSNSYILKTASIIGILRILLISDWQRVGTVVTGLVHRYASEFWNGAQEVHEAPRAQADPDAGDLISLLITLFTALAGAFAVGKTGLTDKMSDKMKNIGEKLRTFNFTISALKSFTYIKDTISQIVDTVINQVIEWTAPHILATMKLKEGFEDIENLSLFLDKHEKDIQYKLALDFNLRLETQRMYDVAKRLQVLVVTSKLGLKARLIRDLIRRMDAVNRAAKDAIQQLPTRIDPFCVALTGVTRLGKSGCIGSLMNDVMDELGYGREDRTVETNPAEKFFNEAYDCHPHVYMDDFSAFNSIEQYTNFFNLKSNSKFPLNMAFAKGKMFTSDFISMTTNHPYPQPNELAYVDALWQRRNILVEADWANDDLRVRAEAGENVKELDHSHLKFRFKDPSSNLGPITRWMTYRQAVTHITDRAREHLRVQRLKVAHDIRNSGIALIEPPLPQAQQDEAPSWDKEILYETYLGLDEEALPYMSMHDGQLFFDASTPADILDEFGELTQVRFQHTLAKFWIKPQQKETLTKLQKIHTFIGKCTEVITDFLKNLPFAGIAKTMGALLCTGLATFALTNLTFGIVHKCVCKTSSYFGWRCKLCGKWPKLANCTDQEFMLEQWKEIYGTREYTDGHVTSREEEIRYRELTGMQNAIGQLYSYLLEQGHDPTGILLGTKTAHAGNPYSSDSKSPRLRRVIAHHGLNADSTSIVENAVMRNSFKLKTKNGIVSLFVVSGRQGLTVGHVFKDVEIGETFWILRNDVWISQIFHDGTLVPFPGKDLVLVNLSAQWNMCKSIVNHFIAERDLGYVQNQFSELCCLRLDKRDKEVWNRMTARVNSRGKIDYDLTNKDKTKTVIYEQDSWSYPMHTKNGDCGSPLVTHSQSINVGKIIGLHICGDDTYGWSTLVTREMLEDKIAESAGTPLPRVSTAQSLLIPNGNLSHIGKVTDGGVHTSSKTQLKHTPFHDEIFQHETEPAVLYHRDPRLDKIPTYPMTQGISKYAKTLTPFNQKDIEDITSHLIDDLDNRLEPLRPMTEILTMEQTINGIPSIPFYDRMNMQSSPGYPWIKTKRQILLRESVAVEEHKGKKYLFDVEAGRIRDKELQKAFDLRLAEAQKGNRVPSVWVDCLKDEKRKVEKIKQGKTRVFTIPPVDFTLLARKYLLDFSAMMKASFRKTWCKVGINPESLDWQDLYYTLTSHSNLVVAGDFAAFDGTIPAEIIQQVAILVIGVLKRKMPPHLHDELSRVITVIFDEIIHTVQLAKEDLYMTHQGNPSGNPLTDLLNSIVHYYYLAYSYIDLARKTRPDLATLSQFDSLVKKAIYGDDDLVAIDGDIIDWFNQETITEVMARHGITYTDDTKKGITKFKDIKNCTFLKRTFRWHEEFKVVVPNMSLTTIHELTNWMRESPDLEEQLAAQLNDALRFMYFYGRADFDTLRTQLVQACHRHNLNVNLDSFASFDQAFRNTIGI